MPMTRSAPRSYGINSRIAPHAPILKEMQKSCLHSCSRSRRCPRCGRFPPATGSSSTTPRRGASLRLAVAEAEMQAIAGSHKSGAARLGDPASPTRTVCGPLTIFSAAERHVCEPLLRAFARQHPTVEIDFVFGISSELHRRYLGEVESGRPTASLLWSSAMDLQMALVIDGHARPHNVRPNISLAPAWRDTVAATTYEPLFNLSRHVPAPRTLGEVATLIKRDAQRFHRRIVVPDIESNGLGFFG